MDSKPTVLMMPCFAGAPWQLDRLQHLHEWPMHTMRLPESGRYSAGVRTFLQSTIPAIGGAQ
jgi:hypothetical protein